MRLPSKPRRILRLALPWLLSGCGGLTTASGTTSAPKQLTLAELAGTYETKCLKASQGFEISTLVVKAGSVVETIRRYENDGTCSDDRKVVTRQATYAAKEDFDAAQVEEALEIRPTPVRLTVEEITLTAHEAKMAEALSVAKAYDFTDWKAGEAKSVAGRTLSEGRGKEAAKAETSYVFLGLLEGRLTRSAEAPKASQIEYKKYNDDHVKK